MKKFILLIALFAITTISFAQQRPQQRKMPTAEEMIKKATETLKLSDDQVKQWMAIHEEYGAPPKDRTKGEAWRKKLGAELEATLTDEQKEKFKEMREQRQAPPRRN